MILIGQFDSPFVRRVGIALTLYGKPFEHRPWSAMRDADKMRSVTPLMRVPTLVLDDGTALCDSSAILDYLDNTVPVDVRLTPATEPQRHRVLRVAALACGAGDKAVSLFYEKRLHERVSDAWVARCSEQVRETFALLERERAAAPGPWWFGERIGNADITLAAVFRFIAEAHPGLLAVDALPAIATHAARCEALPAFQVISQRFIPPA